MHKHAIFTLLLLLCFSMTPFAMAQDAAPTAEVKDLTAPDDTEAELIDKDEEADDEATPETTVKDDFTLYYASPATGEISNNAPTQTWTLETASADRIVVNVERTSGNLLPEIRIIDATGVEIAKTYGIDFTGVTAAIRPLELPSAGVYQVEVSRRNGENGATTGEYSILVTPLATALDNINNNTLIKDIELNTPVTGNIINTHWYHRYTFEADAADLIEVRMMRTSGNLQPRIELLDENGTLIIESYIEASADYAELATLQLPSAGKYTLVATRYNGYSNNTEGGYSLIVDLLGAGIGSASLEKPVGEIEYDTILTGEITHAQWYQDWTFSPETSDVLSFSLERAGGNLRAEISVLDALGDQLYYGYLESTGDKATIRNYTFEAGKNYTIRVQREREQRGVTTGAYTLSANLIGVGEESEIFASPVGTISPSDAVSGTLSAAEWQQAWLFEATAGQNLIFKATRTSGTLIPLLNLYNAEGEQIASRYYEDTYDAANLRYYIMEDGEYQIVITRDYRKEGLTSGDYDLVLIAE